MSREVLQDVADRNDADDAAVRHHRQMPIAADVHSVQGVRNLRVDLDRLTAALGQGDGNRSDGAADEESAEQDDPDPDEDDDENEKELALSTGRRGAADGGGF